VIPNRFRLGNSRGNDFILQWHTFVAVLLEDIDMDDFRNSYKEKGYQYLCFKNMPLKFTIKFLYRLQISFVGLVSAVQHLQHLQYLISYNISNHIYRTPIYKYLIHLPNTSNVKFVNLKSIYKFPT